MAVAGVLRTVVRRVPGAGVALQRAAPVLSRFYPTPKVDVRAVVAGERGILLVRHAENGRWALPGGFADVGEAPAEAIEREVLEETGLRVRASRLAAVLDVPPTRRGLVGRPNVYRMFLVCDEVAPPASWEPDAEIDAHGFFAADALPELCPKRFSAAQAQLVFAHLADPARQADFRLPDPA
jgi:ADP-ribose pyrophosphatase YjhB (NUDIX family)